MTTTLAPPDRSMQQRLDALKKANAIRVKRARIKRRLAAAETGHAKLVAVTIMRSNDKLTSTMRIRELLLAVPSVGPVKAAKVLKAAEVSPSRTLGGLTERQKLAIEKQLIGGLE